MRSPEWLLGCVNGSPGDSHPQIWGQRDCGVMPYPGFHQQLPSDSEHGGEAKGGAHCVGGEAEQEVSHHPTPSHSLRRILEASAMSHGPSRPHLDGASWGHNLHSSSRTPKSEMQE